MKVLKLNVVSDSLPGEQLGRLILAFQSFLNILRTFRNVRLQMALYSLNI